MEQLISYTNTLYCLVDLENYHNKIGVDIFPESMVVNIHPEVLLLCLPNQ
jgi:hypothetical protein